MLIKANKEIEVEKFTEALHRAEFDSYTPEELRAFCKGVRCALVELGIDADTVSDVREYFEQMYFDWE